MRAIFVLLLDYPVHNFIRKLAVEVQQKYPVALTNAPPHVSLKQSFRITDLAAVERYFDQFAASIDPFEVSLPRIGGPEDAPILWLEVEATEMLRNLHARLNQELAERFPHTQADFDGPDYHFHATIVKDEQPIEVYRTLVAELESREVALRTTARYLALLYKADDQAGPGHFVMYKVLPLGQEQSE